MSETKYRMEYRAQWYYDCFQHFWIIEGAKGAVHFHTDDNEERRQKYGGTAGLEIHWRTPPPYMANDAPSQSPCWLLNQPCWHDGTSLYAMETLFPLVDFSDPLRFFKYLKPEMKRFDDEESPDVAA